MSDNSWTAEIVVPQSPEQVFDAVRNVRGWWWNEAIEGETAEVGDEFTFGDGSLWCRFRLTEVTPGSRVVWQALDSELGFVEDRHEWTGTQVVFDITATPEGSRLRFTHEGLRPTVECYDACTRGWDYYVNRCLKDLITGGSGEPMPKP